MSNTVFSGFVVSWFFAASPISRSPSGVNATYDGVIRLPWSLAIISTRPFLKTPTLHTTQVHTSNKVLTVSQTCVIVCYCNIDLHCRYPQFTAFCISTTSSLTLVLHTSWPWAFDIFGSGKLKQTTRLSLEFHQLLILLSCCSCRRRVHCMLNVISQLTASSSAESNCS